MPAGGQDTGSQPSPSSPPAPKHCEKPALLCTEKRDDSEHTRSMFPAGRVTVTLQPVDVLCDDVPPGHSAESNRPPLLLDTVKVKLRLPQVQRAFRPQTLLAQSVPLAHCFARPQPAHV